MVAASQRLSDVAVRAEELVLRSDESFTVLAELPEYGLRVVNVSVSARSDDVVYL